MVFRQVVLLLVCLACALGQEPEPKCPEEAKYTWNEDLFGINVNTRTLRTKLKDKDIQRIMAGKKMVLDEDEPVVIEFDFSPHPVTITKFQIWCKFVNRVKIKLLDAFRNELYSEKQSTDEGDFTRINRWFKVVFKRDLAVDNVVSARISLFSETGIMAFRKMRFAGCSVPDEAACEWDNWAPWTPCNRECGLGQKFSTRSCVCPPNVPDATPCKGEDKRSKTCFTECDPQPPPNPDGTK